MRQIVAPDKPTRRTIEALFRDLLSGRSHRDSEYAMIEEQLDNLRKKLLSCPKYKSLEAKAKAARERYYKQESKFRLELDAVRREYQVYGLTPSVLKKIENLVKKRNQLSFLS